MKTILKDNHCPYCDASLPLESDAVYKKHGLYFNGYVLPVHKQNGTNLESEIIVHFLKCPACGKYSISVSGKGVAVSDIGMVHVRPFSRAKSFPDYIPLPIRQDYEEAYSILELSPKASATLSRRCLQGMIRDFFGISGKKNLKDEIDAIQKLIPAAQWNVLNQIRKIGNIGAHMEKDVNLIIDINPDEAEKLLQLIELLMQQWYIDRHNQEQLYAEIAGISLQKEAARHQ